MAYNYEYPYTDPNRYNADWLLNEMKRLHEKLDGLTDEAVTISKKYTDEKHAWTESEIASLKNKLDDCNNSIIRVRTSLTEEVARLDKADEENKIYASDLIRTEGIATDKKIANAKVEIVNDISANLTATAKVTNYFTGALVTIQEMFNTLAKFHLDDALDYATLAEKQLSYTALANKNITYTELLTKGGTII